MTEVRLNALSAEVRRELQAASDTATLSDDALYERIEALVLRRSRQEAMSIQDRVDAARKAYQSLRGLDLLDDLLADERVTGVTINGPRDIFVERDGRVVRLEQGFETEADLERVVRRLVEDRGAQTLDAGNPIVETRLVTDERRAFLVNAVLPPVSAGGPVVTLRETAKPPMTAEQLTELGVLAPDTVEILQALVEARYNIFVSGAVGTGKMSLLNALCGFIPKDERVVTIEETPELRLNEAENLVSLTASGGTTTKRLVEAASRLCPDRVVVGEVRGDEAAALVEAMNAGQNGTLAAIRAGSAERMLSRLEAMILRGSDLPLLAVRQQLGSALDIIIQLERLSDRSRRVTEIAEVCGMDGERLALNCLYRLKRDKSGTRLARTKNEMKKARKLETIGRGGLI